MIGIIAAMETELRLIKDKLVDVTAETKCGITFYRGKYENKEVVAAVCGIGKVFAAMCAEAMIISYSPDVIINTGVAGSLSDKLRVLDCAVADESVQHDMDTTPFGDPKGMISGINKVYFECDAHCVDLLASAADEIGVRNEKGVIASGDCFVNSSAKRDELRSEFNAIICEMESGAIGHVCYVNEVPFCVLRTVSDNGDDDSHNDYAQSLAKAAKAELDILVGFLKKLGAEKN